MAEMYHEMVIEGPSLLVKGYVAGLLVGAGLNLDEIRCADELPVDCESLVEQFSEWIHLHGTHSHLLVPHRLHGEIKRRMEQARDLIGLKVLSDREIRSASFPFSFEVYAKRHFIELKELLRSVPDTVHLSDDFAPTETIDPSAKGAELYTTAHEYEASGKGTVTGDWDSIHELHQSLAQRSMVKAGKIRLHHADG